MDAQIEEVIITFDTHGSLATTHDSQGSDMGLFGGLLGWRLADERLAESPYVIQEAGIRRSNRDQGFGRQTSQHLSSHPQEFGRTAQPERHLHRRRDDRDRGDRRR